MYVDSDDWMETTFIETMYKAIEKTNADYVSSVGFYKVNNNEIDGVWRSLPAGVYCDDIGKITVLLGDSPVAWKKIYNKQWLIKQSLFQPELFHYEDWGYDIYLILQSKKIVLIPEIGMFYRVNREDSLEYDDMVSIYNDFKKTLEIGLEEAEKRGLLHRYRDVITKYILRDLSMRRNIAQEAKNEKALGVLTQIEKDFLVDKLKYHNINMYGKYICFGSFSLRWIMQRTFFFQENENIEYFGFSSLISSLSKGKKIEVEHDNKFREIQVQQDIAGKFKENLESLEEETVLFVDFLEEYSNILQLKDGTYITKSQALMGIKEADIKIIREIQSGTEEATKLWKKSCQNFSSILREKKDLLRIILVKNRMSEVYGDLNVMKQYENISEIRRINTMISEMEDYFIDTCKENNLSLLTFELPAQYCVTFENFKYGCEPQYMNEALYTYLGYEIFKTINNEA
jgi:hypothetical protein